MLVEPLPVAPPPVPPLPAALLPVPEALPPVPVEVPASLEVLPPGMVEELPDVLLGLLLDELPEPEVP